MMKNIILTLLLCLTLTACGSLRTFHDYARAGDTVAVAVGMQPDFNKDNITVTITPSSGPDIVLTATDPAIRSIVNLYPDPISNMIVSKEIGSSLTPFAETYADTVLTSANDDKDYFQTTVFVDLPTSLPTGLTEITVDNGNVATQPIILEIIPGTGVANTFQTDLFATKLDANMLDAISRAPHTIVSFDGPTPITVKAIEVNFTHDPDQTAGGAGKAAVVNPLGSRKGLAWSDDGTAMKVILTESLDGIIDDMKDYKFYIAGTVSNLVPGTVTGYDSNGDEVPGVTMSLAQN